MGYASAGFGLCTALLVLVGCSQKAPRPGAVNEIVKPDFIITFDGPARSCRLKVGASGLEQSVPCLELAAHLRQVPEITATSYFEAKTIPDIDVAQYDAVMATLAKAGYKLTPGPHVNFLTEPKGANDR
jgi:hypothetical protein